MRKKSERIGQEGGLNAQIMKVLVENTIKIFKSYENHLRDGGENNATAHKAFVDEILGRIRQATQDIIDQISEHQTKPFPSQQPSASHYIVVESPTVYH